MVLNDDRYENVKQDLEKMKQKGEEVSMDPYLDMILDKREEREVKQFAKLMEHLLASGLLEEAKEAAANAEVRKALCKKYSIAS